MGEKAQSSIFRTMQGVVIRKCWWDSFIHSLTYSLIHEINTSEGPVLGHILYMALCMYFFIVLTTIPAHQHHLVFAVSA